jgi:hypothetical protein
MGTLSTAQFIVESTEKIEKNLYKLTLNNYYNNSTIIVNTANNEVHLFTETALVKSKIFGINTLIKILFDITLIKTAILEKLEIEILQKQKKQIKQRDQTINVQ